MRTLWQDIRQGLRMLWRQPGFTLASVLALALGIGANTAIFSVVNAVLLRPLPFAAPERLVGLRETLPDEGSIPLAYRTYAEWRDRNTVFENVAATANWNANLENGDEPVRLSGAGVTASYFGVMGVQPVLGRGFVPEEDQPGGAKVVVLGYDLWRAQFGGDRRIVGQSLRINGLDYKVVGVMPPALNDDDIGWQDIWTPLATDDQKARLNYGRYLSANARLRPGATLAQARAELARLMASLKQDYRETHGKDYGVDVRPLKDFVVERSTRTALLVLLGAVLFVLLIACANVASLSLARAAAREKEITVRLALGASRLRIARQLLTESVLLSLFGAAVGVLLALWATDLLIALIPDAIPRLSEVRINGAVLGFTLALTLLTGIAFGLAPALGATKLDLNETLKTGGHGGGKGRRQRRLHGLLVGSQIALAFVLLIGSGLMIKSFLRLRDLQPGFDPDHVLTMEVSLPFRSYPEPQQRVNFYRQTLERIRALPGVEIASATQSLPLRPTFLTDAVFVAGRPAPPRGQEPLVRGTAITADYFRALRMPLVKGRSFTEQETWQTGGVVVVNEAFARRFFLDGDPLGQRMQAGFDTPWLTVVGVVADSVQGDFRSRPVEEMFYTYVNATGPPVVRMNFVVRTTTDPATLASAVRGVIRDADRNLPVSNVLSMRQLADRTLNEPRFDLLLINLFAATALALAAIGIFGVMSYTVTQRTREIGIRLALGALPRDMLRMVLRQGLTLALAGVAAGLAVAVGLTRVLASMLYGVSATDPFIFAGIALLLTLVALAACYVPARRATKVDPMVALRYE